MVNLSMTNNKCSVIYQVMNFFLDKIDNMRTIISSKVSQTQVRKNLFMPYSKSIDPKKLFILQCNGLESKRPDIIIRYLAVQDIVNGNIEGGEGLRLYKKFIGANGLDSDSYANKFIVLVNSFADHGYNPNYYLICEKNMWVTNGNHRLACALFFGEKKICFKNTISYWDVLPAWHRLIYAGFSDEEIDFIRQESDKLVESIINNQDIEKCKVLDQRALRKWVMKESKIVYIFNKRKLSENSMVSMNKGEFYQSFPMLGINGVRLTDKRIEQYSLKDLLNNKMDVLDIGCNIGFLDLEIASLVRSVTGIEFNSVVSRLSKSIANKLNIRNATFYDYDFKEWKNLSRRRYDMILSLDVHQYIDLTPQEYAAKIASLIEPGGLLLFESPDLNLTGEPKDYDDYIDAFMNNGFRSIKRGDSMDQESSKRKWTLLQQNKLDGM